MKNSHLAPPHPVGCSAASQVVDRSPSLVIDPFIFKKEEWETSADKRGIRGIPRTWCLPFEGTPKEYLAFLCCPNCHNILIIHTAIHKINPLGKVSPSIICKYEKCSFHRNAYLDNWNNKPLYACAIEHIHLGKVTKTEIIYTHASNEKEARIALGLRPITSRIAAIGPAIGFFVHDKHGDVLSTD